MTVAIGQRGACPRGHLIPSAAFSSRRYSSSLRCLRTRATARALRCSRVFCFEGCLLTQEMSPNSRGDASTTSVIVSEIAEYALNPRKPGRVSDLAWGIRPCMGCRRLLHEVSVLHEVSHLHEVMNSPSLPEHSSLRGTNPYRNTAGDSSTLHQR